MSRKKSSPKTSRGQMRRHLTGDGRRTIKSKRSFE